MKNKNEKHIWVAHCFWYIEEALRLGAADLFGRANTANDSGLVEPEKPYKANGYFPLIQSSLAYVIYS